jgi:hypothetical protein
MTESVRLTLREKTFELPIIVGAEGEVGIDIRPAACRQRTYYA